MGVTYLIKNEYNYSTMKTKISILLTILLMLSCVPAQTNAGTLSSKLSSAISKVHNKIDSAFSKVKAKFTKSKETKSAETSETEKKSVFSKALDKARSVLKESFNMNFLSSVPVVFWRKTFDRMFDYAQTSVDEISKEHNGELITRDDFQDDKALHIKKSAELALHIKSLFGSSVFAYGVTLAVGGIKELIDSSFLNPNGGRCWEDFYADMVGASAVFGEKAFDKKLNKYMDSFLKENRKVDMVDNNNVIATCTANISESYEVEEEIPVEEVEETIIDNRTIENTSSNFSDTALEKQRLTVEYYEAVRNGDTEAVKKISEQLRNLK